MFKNHQSHDIARRGQIGTCVESSGEAHQVLIPSQVQYTRLGWIRSYCVSMVLKLSCAGNVPSAPSLVYRSAAVDDQTPAWESERSIPAGDYRSGQKSGNV